MNRKLLSIAVLQLGVVFALVWFIAGNDRLFRSTVPIEQRLVSHNDSIRTKAQQELLGLEIDEKKRAVSRLIPALSGDDIFTRKWSAIALALVGPAAQEAIPALLQTVSAKEKDVAQASRVALSEIGAPDAQQLPSLLRTLQDPRDSVRCEAAASMGKMGPAAQEAVPILLGYLRRPIPTPACFEDALAALAPSVPSIPPALIALLGSPRADLRGKASRALSQITLRLPEEAVAILRDLAMESDGEVRLHLAKALAMPEGAALGLGPVCASALRGSKNELVRLSALDLVRHVTLSPSDLEILWGEGLRDPSASVRLGVARWIRAGLTRGGNPGALIARMLKDPEPAIRRLGLESLRKSGLRSSDLLQKVAKAQRDADPGVRCRAAETLVEAGMSDRVSIALLIGDLRKDEDTARCAEDVLGLAGFFDRDVVHSMTRLVQEDKDPDVRSRAARVLMHLGPRAREAIAALLHAQKDEIPGAAMALRAIRATAYRRRS